ncbi:AraC family transcriptional regulator [Vibrio sp. 10N]|uniref:AraC family transcriptional regulator n=1 Tax=Vibrio sp. 10N TaxID=3058938 RepID=UPI002813D0DC|nr:AraC family transcriptional regulator [Vibrio sp. 10N]
MKPLIENVLSENDFNWSVKEFYCHSGSAQRTCTWHYHSEYELVLYRDPQKQVSGHYFAGDSVNDIHHNCLLLYGPGLPHMVTGSIKNCQQPEHSTLILWFRHQWIESLIETLPEFRHLKRILAKAACGLTFSAETAEFIYEQLRHLEQYETHHQLIRVLRALSALVDDENAQALSITPYGMQHIDDHESTRRVELARRFIEQHYAEPIKVGDLCQALHISESSAYRLFERHFLENFSEHLKRFRIGKACEMLVNGDMPVASIAELSGFNNVSNFNRQFKGVKGITPSQFRAQYLTGKVTA